MPPRPVKDRIAPPQQFKAKKRGYYYQVAEIHPDREAQWDAFLRTANAKLENVALAEGMAGKTMPLWIHNLETGYTVTGTKSQGPQRAAFYPNGAAHNDITITGIVPSNYMYDQLVEFITIHHQYALNAIVDFDGAWIGDDANGTLPLRFTLYDKGRASDQGYHKHKPVQISCYISTIQAGAQRFQNAREYQLTLMVVNNYRDTDTYTERFDDLLSAYTNNVFVPRPKQYVPSQADAGDRGTIPPPPTQADR